MTALDALMERLGDNLAEEVVPKLIAELSAEERERIRAAVVEKAIETIKAGQNSATRNLADRAASEVWDMLRKHPLVVGAIQAAADDLAAAAVDAIQKAQAKVRGSLINRFDKLLRDGY